MIMCTGTCVCVCVCVCVCLCVYRWVRGFERERKREREDKEGIFACRVQLAQAALLFAESHDLALVSQHRLYHLMIQCSTFMHRTMSFYSLVQIVPHIIMHHGNLTMWTYRHHGCYAVEHIGQTVPCTDGSILLWQYICVCVCVYVCVCVCVCARAYVCLRMCLGMCLCTVQCTYLCACVDVSLRNKKEMCFHVWHIHQKEIK